MTSRHNGSNNLLQRFPQSSICVATIATYLQFILVVTLTLTVSVIVFREARDFFFPILPEPLAFGLAGALTLLATVFALGLIIALLGSVFRLGLRPGKYPMYSWRALFWATYNFYITIYRYSLMNFIRATPLHVWFYRLMGAQIGRGVMINTKIIADCSMLTIGDRSVIGGEATVICHSFEHGRLTVRPVRIGSDVTIGLNAVVFPGVTVGDGAVIAAGSIVLKDTKVPAGSTWAGVPARQVRP